MWRKLLFILVCIPIRLLLAFFTSKVDKNVLKILGFLFLIPSFGWIYLWFVNKSKGFFGGKVWWNSMRPIHALIWLIFGITTVFGFKNTYLLLYLDVILGLLAFIKTNYLSIH